MAATKQPFNISILNLTKEKLRGILPITALDTYDGMTSNFHDGGLFSTLIFGRVGSKERDRTFAYINLKVKILHPAIYKDLISLKDLYRGIINGTEWAYWDDTEKDFIRTDPIGGSTGIAFFYARWADLVFKETGSDERAIKIAMINKFRDIAWLDKILVMPAGYRDVETDKNGRPTQDEINDHYRRCLQIANTIADVNFDYNINPNYDQQRRNMQYAVVTIYNMLENMLSGKTGFFQDKWASRRIVNGTRNVLSSLDVSSYSLNDPRAPSIDRTEVGIYQTLKGLLPIANYRIRNGWVGQVFGTNEQSVYLTNTDTLKRELVDLPYSILDQWTTKEGIEKLINSFEDETIRQQPVIIDGYYLGLIYIDKNSFKIFGDIDELPDHLDQKNVSPLTLTQLIYLSGYAEWNNYGGFFTRFPVTGTGSTYPTEIYLRTTIRSSTKYERSSTWEIQKDRDHQCLEFPDTSLTAKFMESLSPHPAFLPGLGGD